MTNWTTSNWTGVRVMGRFVSSNKKKIILNSVSADFFFRCCVLCSNGMAYNQWSDRFISGHNVFLSELYLLQRFVEMQIRIQVCRSNMRSRRYHDNHARMRENNSGANEWVRSRLSHEFSGSKSPRDRGSRTSECSGMRLKWMPTRSRLYRASFQEHHAVKWMLTRTRLSREYSGIRLKWMPMCDVLLRSDGVNEVLSF